MCMHSDILYLKNNKSGMFKVKDKLRLCVLLHIVAKCPGMARTVPEF